MSHFITLAEGQTMAADYRAIREDMLSPDYQGADVLPLCETFDRSAIDAILSQPSCTALRIYFGISNGKVQAILVGVNDADEDLLPDDENAANEQIADRSRRCPPSCPPASAMNS